MTSCIVSIPILAAAMTVGITAAWGQPAVPQPDPARVVAARQLVQDTGGGARAEQVMSMMRGLFMTMLKNKARQPDQAGQVIDEILLLAVRQHLPELQDQIAALYATDMSLADLQALDGFYRSPLGRRSLDVQQRILGQMLPVTVALAQRIVPDILKARADALRHRGVSL